MPNNPKPVTLTQIPEDEYTGQFVPVPLVVVGDIPGAGGGGGGMVQYPDSAALDAVALPEVGILVLADTAATYPELSPIVGNGASVMVVTTTISDNILDLDDLPENPEFANYANIVQYAIAHTGQTGSDDGTRMISRMGILDLSTGQLVLPWRPWMISRMVPEAPATGTYTLKSFDGQPFWIEDAP